MSLLAKAWDAFRDADKEFAEAQREMRAARGRGIIAETKAESRLNAASRARNKALIKARKTKA
jgi:hypothetical protein